MEADEKRASPVAPVALRDPGAAARAGEPPKATPKESEVLVRSARELARELSLARATLEANAARAEWALRASEARFRAIFNQVAVGIGLAGLDGRFLQVNGRFAGILGYSPEQLRELTFTQITHPEDIADTHVQMQRLLAQEIPHYVIEKRYVRNGGGIVWCCSTVALIRDAEGRPQQFIGIVEDITSRRQAEEHRNRMAAVVESSDDAIVSKTLEGMITSWNAGAEQMFGYTAAEIVGKPATTLIPPDRLAEEPLFLTKLARGERIAHYETRRVRKDGTIFDVSLTLSPIKDHNGRTIGASKIARDISERKRAEISLREADLRKDEFLAILAHELRNPLAPIRQAALISQAPNATEAQKRWSHDVITRQVQHMSLLLDDLLDISRITRGTLELRKKRTELASIIDAAIETARPAIDAKRHVLSVKMPPAPVYFEADALRLAQVLSNLLTNAAKYTDPDGDIRLSAERVSDTIIIRVIDSGIGISPGALGEIFRMFSQVSAHQDRSDGGLGIGLALAKGLVTLHGGEIEAKSAGLGRGSEFIVRLPIEAEPAAGVAATQKNEIAAPPARHRILVADDNRDAAESLAMLLQLDGHEVTVATDGPEAVSVFAQLQPDVVILDIGMPGLNGYEVARRMRTQSGKRRLRLIAVTGWGQQADKALAFAAGFDHHFTKPLEPSALTELLHSQAFRS